MNDYPELTENGPQSDQARIRAAQLKRKRNKTPEDTEFLQRYDTAVKAYAAARSGEANTPPEDDKKTTVEEALAAAVGPLAEGQKVSGLISLMISQNKEVTYRYERLLGIVMERWLIAEDRHLESLQMVRDAMIAQVEAARQIQEAQSDTGFAGLMKMLPEPLLEGVAGQVVGLMQKKGLLPK